MTTNLKLERTLYIKWMICIYILFLFAPWPILTEVEHSLFLHDFQFYLFILENDEEVSMYFSEISCWPGLGIVALCLVNHKWWRGIHDNECYQFPNTRCMVCVREELQPKG
jgi:hypothetical protein